jgi:hypothetical protein
LFPAVSRRFQPVLSGLSEKPLSYSQVRLAGQGKFRGFMGWRRRFGGFAG